MKKLIILIGLFVALNGWAQDTQDYWVYIRTYDKYALNYEDTIGRSKKGDIVQIVPVVGGHLPTPKEQKEWAIVKVTGLTKEDIENLTQKWENEIPSQKWENEIPFKDSSIFTEKAYRRNKLDIDTLNLKVGINKTILSATTIKTLLSPKTELDILSYRVGQKVYALASFFSLTKAYAADSTSKVCAVGDNCTDEDYNTLTAWEDAKDGEEGKQIAECYDDDGTISDTISISGHSSTGYNDNMVITAPEGERHGGTISTGVLISGSSNAVVLSISDQYTEVSWIKLTQQQSYGKGGIYIFSGGEYTKIHHNIIYDVRSNGAYRANICVGYPGNGAVEIYRNLVYGGEKDSDNNANSGCGFFGGGSGATSSPKIYNNTFFDCVNNLVQSNGGGGGGGLPDVQNNAIFTTDASCLSGSFSVENYNCISDTTGTGGNDVEEKNDSDQFTSVGAGTENLHLKTGADCLDMGSTLGSPYDYDIDNVQVSGTYDAGADEYVSAGGGSILPAQIF